MGWKIDSVVRGAPARRDRAIAVRLRAGVIALFFAALLFPAVAASAEETASRCVHPSGPATLATLAGKLTLQSFAGSPNHESVAQGSDDDKAAAARLHIGDTGIRCARLPCPSRALFEPQPPGSHAARDRMLYVDSGGGKPPPPMIGDPADLAVIRRGWEERQCLALDGRLISGEDDRPVLRVDRVVGPCRIR